MIETPAEDGLRVIGDGDAPRDDEGEDARRRGVSDGHGELESLRDEFVGAFNARDLDRILAVVHTDVDTPDVGGNGATTLAEELEAIWERSPGAILTRAFLDSMPCAVGWLPDEGCWSRAALVCFDCDDGLLNLVSLPDDADALDRAQADDPAGEAVDEWSDWAGWERGEETLPTSRTRPRP